MEFNVFVVLLSCQRTLQVTAVLCNVNSQTNGRPNISETEPDSDTIRAYKRRHGRRPIYLAFILRHTSHSDVSKFSIYVIIAHTSPVKP